MKSLSWDEGVDHTRFPLRADAALPAQLRIHEMQDVHEDEGSLCY